MCTIVNIPDTTNKWFLFLLCLAIQRYNQSHIWLNIMFSSKQTLLFFYEKALLFQQSVVSSGINYDRITVAELFLIRDKNTTEPHLGSHNI